MHSLRAGKWLALGGLVGCVRCAAVPPPVITPAPELDEFWVKRQIADPVSFAQLLLTAIPESLRQIAATNAPAVSSILWEEFLDDKKPQWFLDLPWEVQSYLVKQFGPSTAWYPPSPTDSAAQVTPTISMWTWPTNSGSLKTSQPTARSFVRSSSAVRSSASSTRSQSSLSTSILPSAKTPASTAENTNSKSASPQTDAPQVSNAGLTKQQKVGLGIGIPFGILGAAALCLSCCFLLRRRRNKKHNSGTERPSSPGFIPRFAFQDKSTDNFEHRKSLNPRTNHSSRDVEAFDWDDDGVDPFEYDSTAYRGHTLPPAAAAGAITHRAPAGVPPTAPMAMQDATPIMAPALYHTHSSNRARGKRTSYSSLHSVAEVSEPEDIAESPVIGRHAATPLERKRHPSMPMVLEMPHTIAATAAGKSSIKRKPVPSSPVANPTADLASQNLLRPTMPPQDHSGSSSSGLALSTTSSTRAEPSYGNASPISPVSDHHPFKNNTHDKSVNPFSNDYSYVEDYGPEYQGGYVDVNDGLYGGHKSLNRYPDPSPPPRRGSKTDWPLRNISLGRKREKTSPVWDRVYGSP